MIAVVLDTNFVIANPSSDLIEMIESLPETHSAFITKISIDERQGQKYIEVKEKYGNIDRFINEYSSLVNIQVKEDFDIYIEKLGKFSLDSYKSLFKDNIIHFEPTSEFFSVAIDRAYKKTPPFSRAKNSSDKGFKDTLIWISMLHYFKTCTDFNSVVFLTDDMAFHKEVELLKEEFFSITGKELSIEKNMYFHELVNPKGAERIETEFPKTILSISKDELNDLRKQIENTVDNMAFSLYEDDWGEHAYRSSFELHEKIDVKNAESLFENLPQFLNDNIFLPRLEASQLFEKIDISATDNYFIKIEKFENLLNLFNKISLEHNELLPNFLSAFCKLINRNYIQLLDDDDLPF